MAAEIDSALEAELWASHVLGTFWRGRYELPFVEGAGIDPALEYGEPLLRQFARLDEPGAALATMAIAELEDGELGLQAKELLDSARMWSRLPTWAADIGQSEITGAAVMRDPVFDDARTVFLESRHADGERLAVGVLLDNNFSGMAKDVLLADSIDAVERAMRSHPAGDGIGQLECERVPAGVAAGLIAEAIEVTDMTWDPPVGDDYWSGRALALLRADQTSNVVWPQEPPELPEAEREALRARFLAAPEGHGFAPDGDEAWVALLAIDFAAGYLGSDPLRWSPSVVELFMLDWVPRKVITTEAMLGVLPHALDAWVRFAGGARGLPERAIAITREAISEFAAEMLELASDGAVAGPAKQFLIRARSEGVDIEDAAALERFIAREQGSVSAAGSGAAGIGSGASGLGAELLQVKLTLARVTKPPVWRRLQLPLDTPLDELHRIIQVAFGWEDYHLHMFEAGAERFGPADPDLMLDCADERCFVIGDLAAEVGERVTYTYDFGDCWVHEIVVEKLLALSPDASYPALLAAKGACPPEDCGGVWGYESLKAVLADPEHERHEELREWHDLTVGERFDPAAVDLERIRAALAEGVRQPS